MRAGAEAEARCSSSKHVLLGLGWEREQAALADWRDSRGSDENAWAGGGRAQIQSEALGWAGTRLAGWTGWGGGTGG